MFYPASVCWPTLAALAGWLVLAGVVVGWRRRQSFIASVFYCVFYKEDLTYFMKRSGPQSKS